MTIRYDARYSFLLFIRDLTHENFVIRLFRLQEPSFFIRGETDSTFRIFPPTFLPRSHYARISNRWTGARHGAEYLESRSISAFLTMLRLFSVGDCKPKLYLGCSSKSKRSEFNRGFRSRVRLDRELSSCYIPPWFSPRDTCQHVPTRCARAVRVPVRARTYTRVHARATSSRCLLDAREKGTYALFKRDFFIWNNC